MIFSFFRRWIARLRGQPVEAALVGEPWDNDEGAWVDDDTPEEIAAQHEARANEIRSDLLDDDTP